MIIEKHYKDEPDEPWAVTTLAECLEHTEGCGYWKENTVTHMLESGLGVWTPFAEYRTKK